MKHFPNIVLILADDLGYGDLSCLNEASKIETPHMDLIASEGMTFTDAHASSSSCTPSRYSILTGRYSWRGRLQRKVLGPLEDALIEPNILTLPRFLQKQGYHTACIGKWHLGMKWPFKNPRKIVGLDWGGAEIREALNDIDFNKTILNGPLSHGFDSYFGVDVPDFPPYCFIENDLTIGIPNLKKPDEMFGYPGIMVEGWDLEQIHPQLTKKALSYIKKRALDRLPFFLYFSSTAPHTPIVPIKQFQGQSRAGAYGDFVMQLDNAIGLINTALKQQNLETNTLVIVTSDNGSPGRYGSLESPGSVTEMFDHQPNWILRGLKADTWDGGHRVPFIVKWPNHIPPNSICKDLICLMDLFATCASILNMDIPVDAAEDSFNILPYFLGKKLETPIRKELVHQGYFDLYGIRRIEWKLILGQGSGGLSPNPPITVYDPPQQLYNMEQDIRERENLYFQYPEQVECLTNIFAKHQRHATAPHTRKDRER